jgi:hypothetical protein
MKNKNSWLLIILVIVGLTGCASMQSPVKEPSLPNDINIISPSPDLPKNITVFSGEWKGRWDHGMDTILVVEEIQETRGKIVWAWGDIISLNIPAGHRRFEVEVISSPKPKIQWFPREVGWPDVISLEVMDSNTLWGNMSSSAYCWSSGVIMKRTN